MLVSPDSHILEGSRRRKESEVGMHAIGNYLKTSFTACYSAISCSCFLSFVVCTIVRAL